MFSIFNKLKKRKQHEYNILSQQTQKLDENILTHIEIRQKDTVIDCGASIGDVTDVVASTGATVYSFEANPITFSYLEKRFKNYPNVTCFNKAVSTQQGKTSFFLHEDFDGSEEKLHSANGSSLLHFKSNVNTKAPVEVETLDLCEFLKSLKRKVRLLKIDIEGAEVDVLNKLIDSGMYKKVELILVETHEQKIPELRTPTEIIRKKIEKLNIKNINLEWH